MGYVLTEEDKVFCAAFGDHWSSPENLRRIRERVNKVMPKMKTRTPFLQEASEKIVADEALFRAWVKHPLVVKWDEMEPVMEELYRQHTAESHFLYNVLANERENDVDVKAVEEVAGGSL